uniref:Small ribosomal subunit protein uS9c n=1 Tax=Stigeoclonium helveticum TaxID=55999 RepID=RR9_STIHE|nr:ribosomal protein S9 [Stigeoclonium helveticum]Q06SF6.1 RecName: Full=Small ribosomal subunit protein uS9c; AltName: Full=30S ribosomal protein S9, chloroplastic [Stigeoclonium helveticum]ABF60201.1 ribosomal protein S9 [Stigeoclonium helveticum]
MSQKLYILAKGIGRRKEAVAQVQLLAGSGQFIINGLPANLYLQEDPRSILAIDAPFKQLHVDHSADKDSLQTLDTIVKVQGGGKIGQANAIKLGVARALCEFNGEYRKSLKDSGFLTQDSRIKERRKYGLKKARKAPQYHKR